MSNIRYSSFLHLYLWPYGNDLLHFIKDPLTLLVIQGSYGHGKPGKVMEFFLMVISRPEKFLGK